MSNASIQQSGNAIILSGNRYRIAFSAENGSILSLTQTNHQGSILQSGEQGLWQVRFRDGTRIAAADFSPGSQGRSFHCDLKANVLHMIFYSEEIVVTVKIKGLADGVEFAGGVRPNKRIVLDFALPARLRFDPDQLERFICPMNGNLSVGTAFKSGFFKRQPSGRYFSCSTPYPDGFADFFHLDTRAGSASIYGVRPQRWPPWEGTKNKQAIFVPGHLACGGDERGGYCDRPFGTYVALCETWRSPTVKLIVGPSAPASLLRYCKDNRIRRRLEDKMSQEMLAKFKNSVLVYYGGNCKEKIEGLDLLPVPAQVHFADYLKGGFDKQYPDHLPPRPDFGTPEEFRAFLRRCRELGHLVMPYTNPTWWCDHPRGPTFEREGEAPLLKTLDGGLSHEQYADNDGFTICHWHPAVQAANRKTRRQFTEEYPVDSLFQDQCGARSWLYDMNPASPAPYAYADGLISMVAEDSRTIPLSTESGWDRIVNYETQLCGMSWAIVPTENGPSWRRLMKEDYPPETWEVFPLAQYIAHDKTAMLYHDLGQFVTNREVLAWTLGLGFCMSYRVWAASLKEDGPREWLRWLDRLQKSVCARYVGKPVKSFEHDRGPKPSLEDDGILRASYGPVKVIANLGPRSRSEGGHALPPFGFYATAPGMVAANLNRLGGIDFGDEGISFVVEGDARKADIWVYAPEEQKVCVSLPAGMSGEVSLKPDSAEPALKLVAQRNILSFRLPSRPGRQRMAPPPDLSSQSPCSYLWHGTVVR